MLMFSDMVGLAICLRNKTKQSTLQLALLLQLELYGAIIFFNH